MKFVNKIAIITFFVVLIGFTPVLNANAKILTGTIYSQLSDEPIIDGYLNDPEWDNAISQSFTMYAHLNQNDTMLIEVKSIYSDYNHITFGFTVHDTNFLGSEVFVIFFNLNDSTDLVQFSGSSPYLENGNDAKGIFLGSNATFDCFTQLDAFNAYWDSNVGGDNSNCIGKCHVESGSIVTIEIDMLLKTTDIPQACDIEIDIGDEIEVFFWYIDNAGYYSGAKTDDTDYDVGILNVGGSPPTSGLSVTPTALLPSILAVNFMAIFIAKKKKK